MLMCIGRTKRSAPHGLDVELHTCQLCFVKGDVSYVVIFVVRGLMVNQTQKLCFAPAGVKLYVLKLSHTHVLVDFHTWLV